MRLRHLIIISLLTACSPIGAPATDSESGTSDLIELDFGFSFELPASVWTVKKFNTAPVLAALAKAESDAVITVNYFDFTIYDEIEVNYKYLKGLLEKNEKSTYKPIKHNYERVNLDKVILSTGEAARLEFTTQNGFEKRHSVVTCLNSENIVFFVSMECREGEFNEVLDDYKALLSSITVK